jgi:vacuolar-type H+-ATPase subunit B/Vma2
MYAAGMTLKAENYQIFKDAFEKTGFINYFT